MTLSSSNPRAKPRWFVLIMIIALCSLALASVAQAVLPGGTTFEGNDGNLVDGDGAGANIDWNNFSSAPGVKTALGTASQFTPATDDTGNSDATIFTKSTKNHAVECPNVGSGSMGGGGNKDDLSRMYLATQTIGSNVYLYLSWVRVYPQNSTTAAANLSFEFNASEDTCADAGYTGTRASSLHPRTAGDMLVLYDFAGGTTSQDAMNPQVRISRWTATGPCEVGNQTAPCWGTVQTLNSAQAEARVNDSTIGSVFDGWVGENIGTVAFGEASINLTAAGVFGSGSGAPTQCVSFGSALGISRSSGNSITSSLSDYVGPVGFTLSNCGRVKITKATDPTGNTTTNFNYSASLTRLPPGSTSTTIPTRVGEGLVIDWTNVVPGTGLYVQEADPGPLYALDSITCTGSTATGISTDTTTNRRVTFDLAAGQTLDCTFTNKLQKLAPALSTDPWIYPNDKATLNANAAFSDITGSVKFRLFDTEANCKATTPSDTVGTGGLRYREIVPLAAGTATSKSVDTGNSSVKIESSATQWWLVDYSGDTNHLARSSNCVEKIAVTLTGDSGP